ncbi:UNVERIFIED_CONTAM: E3 ubiquitin-protein ligase [Sesamum angustifolium]|uniref:E3 ubiquitin-protein ligase n=1 Tax=Sesamum angustifolium TaxID=2727405 RepID=A0AAW2MI32_9LAMI
MAFPILGLHRKSQTNKVPLLMERVDNRSDNEHVIDITSSSDASSSSLSHDRPSTGLEQQWSEDQPSTSSRVPVYQPQLFAAGGSNSRNSSLIRRGNSRGRQRSPLNSGLWISVELVLTVSQIIAAIVVLSLSKHEKPRAPLRAWVVGYASGCLAILPLLYWRFKHRNQGSEQDSSQHRQDSSPANISAVPLTRSHGSRRPLDHWYAVMCHVDLSAENFGSCNFCALAPASTSSVCLHGHYLSCPPSPRERNNVDKFLYMSYVVKKGLKVLIEYFKMALDCFFAVWFVVGNVWIFGGHSSSNEAPNLYRLCIVFLTFSCIGEENKSGGDKENSSSAGEGGIVAAGTEKERAISGEDAVCCICLAKYVHNDELREMPCSHFFHKDCVDKWLKINATCPLCKAEVGETMLSSLTEATASLRNGTLL